MALLESMAQTLISWSKALLFSCPPISVIFKNMLESHIYICSVNCVQETKSNKKGEEEYYFEGEEEEEEEASDIESDAESERVRLLALESDYSTL